MSGTSQTIPSTGGSSTLPASSITMTADSILTNTDVESNLGIVNDSLNFYNGTFLESFDALVTSDGTDITLTLEKVGTGDLTMRFSDGLSTLDCTPKAEIVLTAGTDTSPQANYIYVLQSTSALTKSTTQWPSAEHIKVDYCYVQSAVQVQAKGALINQNWNEGAKDGNNTGHVTHVGQWIRAQGANWFSGVDGAGTSEYITPYAGGGYIKVNAGVIMQMHKHTYPAHDTSLTDVAFCANYPSDNFKEITDLNDMLVDSTNTTLTNRYYNILLGGVANKGGEFSPLMVKLPAGSYNSSANAINDVDGFDDISIARAFGKDSSTGFLIARITLRNQSDTTFTVMNTQDLRGTTNTATSGSIGTTPLTNFSDNQFTVYNNTDPTKIVDLDVSSVTTGTARTLTIPDKDITIADNADIINKTIGTTKGDLIGFSATSTPARLAVGANDTVLVADSTETTGLKWGTAGGGAFELLTPTIADCENTTTATDVITVPITANTWADGETIRVDSWQKGSQVTDDITIVCKYGTQTLFTETVTPATSDGYTAKQMYFKRVGTVIWYSLLSYSSDAWLQLTPGNGLSTASYLQDTTSSAVGRRRSQTFTTTKNIVLECTWTTDHPGNYILLESASAYKIGGTV